MDRRDFLKWAGAIGVGVATPWAWSSPAEAAAYEGPLYMFFNAVGGWDTTMLCDPKGNALNRGFDEGAILTAGNLRYAPVGANQMFFEKYASELLVINGIDMASPNHEIGQRYIWTGKSNDKSFPAFGALAAASAAPMPPMAWLSFGAYDVTGGLVPLSRVQSKDQLIDVLDPGAMEADPARRYHPDFAAERIRQALSERHERKLAAETLPRNREARSTLFASHLGAQQLRDMRALLPAEMPAEINARGMRGAATLAVAAMKSGLCVAANFALAVFDSHDTNDAKQDEGLSVLLRDIDFALEAAEAAGIRDRLTVVLGSDFGRTPLYNGADGKDHWSIGSAMLLGPGIRGNRVIGATDEGLMPKDVDPATLAVSEGGMRLRPEHLHHALREHAGIADSPAAVRYPLLGEKLPLLS